MADDLNATQRLENTAFLRHLRATGNVREAARRAGRAYGTMQHRRRQHPAFAARWDAAIAFAQIRLAKNGAFRPTRPGGAAEDVTAHRTRGGEPVVIQRRDGTLQMRRAQPNKLTRQAEQAFLLALSATANVTLSAAAAGAAEGAFYRRKHRNPAFAREWRDALLQGWDRLQGALHDSLHPASGDDAAWRHNEPPPLPPMTANQMLQLLYLHQKEAKYLHERPYFRTRPGEAPGSAAARVGARYLFGLIQYAETEAAAFNIAGRARQLDPERIPPPIALPDLAQVTTSRTRRAQARDEAAPDRPAGGAASPSEDAPAPGGKVHDASRALFGGWRIGNLTPEQLALAELRRALIRRMKDQAASNPSRRPGSRKN